MSRGWRRAVPGSRGGQQRPAALRGAPGLASALWPWPRTVSGAFKLHGGPWPSAPLLMLPASVRPDAHARRGLSSRSHVTCGRFMLPGLCLPRATWGRVAWHARAELMYPLRSPCCLPQELRKRLREESAAVAAAAANAATAKAAAAADLAAAMQRAAQAEARVRWELPLPAACTAMPWQPGSLRGSRAIMEGCILKGRVGCRERGPPACFAASASCDWAARRAHVHKKTCGCCVRPRMWTRQAQERAAAQVEAAEAVAAEARSEAETLQAALRSANERAKSEAARRADAEVSPARWGSGPGRGCCVLGAPGCSAPALPDTPVPAPLSPALRGARAHSDALTGCGLHTGSRPCRTEGPGAWRLCRRRARRRTASGARRRRWRGAWQPRPRRAPALPARARLRDRWRRRAARSRRASCGGAALRCPMSLLM
jgi:hypothetical protein